MSKSKKRRRQEAEARRHQRMQSHGFVIDRLPGGGQIWRPADLVVVSSKPEHKTKRKYRGVSSDQVDEVACSIFGSTTYFCHQDNKEII